MKNRILALLLAGLITASMVACTDTKRRDEGLGTGTEAIQTKDPNSQGNPNNPSAVTWQDVNEPVYVISDKLTLTPVSGGTSVTASLMNKLTRVKVGSNGQSIVEKDGVQYTVLSKSLSNEDLTGEFYEKVSPAQTMYVTTEGLNIRTYASSQSFSKKVGDGLNLNDTVKVVAKGTKWYMIEHTDGKNYFVSAQYLSTTSIKDINDLKNYPTFTDYTTGPVKMYVIASKSVNLRKAPHWQADLVDSKDVTALLRDAEVMVYADNDIDGGNWSKVVVQNKNGVNVVGFVNSRYLSVNKGGVAQVTLNDMLKDYPDFTQLEATQTLYTMDSLNVRSTPEVINDEKGGNLVSGYEKKGEAVKVVATGTSKGTFWALVEYEEGKFGFASYAFLTTDPSGNPAPASLEQLLATNPNFTALTTTKTVYAKDNTIACLTAPQLDWEDIEKKLGDGESVTVVATAEINYQTWYIYKTADGLYFFGVANWFSESAS